MKTRIALLLVCLLVVPALGGVFITSPKEYNVKTYGATGDGTTDDTAAIQAALDASGNGVVFFPPGTYLCNVTITSTSELYPSLLGSGSSVTIIKPYDTASPAITYTGTGTGWYQVSTVRDLCFKGKTTRVGDGVQLNERGPRGLSFYDCSFYQCDTGFRNNGCIWYNFYNCTFAQNNVATWIESGSTYHGGNAAFVNCNWYNNYLCAVYIKKEGTGLPEQLRFIGGINEGNVGPAFYIKDTNRAWPILIDGMYFESNGTGTDVTLDETLMADPYTMELDDVPLLILQNLQITDIDAYLNDSSVLTINCEYGPDADCYFTQNGNCHIEHNRPYLINSTTQAAVPSAEIITNGFHAWVDYFLRASVRTPFSNNIDNDQTNLWTNGSMHTAFTAVDENGMTNSLVQGDAPGCGQYLSLTLPAGQTSAGGMSLFTTAQTEDKYYVWSFDIKSLAGTVQFNLDSPTIRNVISNDIDVSATEWRRIVGYVGPATETGNQTIHAFNDHADTEETFYLANMQLVEFDTGAEALNYIKDGRYAVKGSGIVRSGLLSVTTVSFAADADTTLYTVPTGYRCALSHAIVVAADDAGATTDLSIGAAAAGTDWVDAITLSNLDAQYDVVKVEPIMADPPPKIKSYAAATVIEAKIANQSGAAGNTIYLYGMLY